MIPYEWSPELATRANLSGLDPFKRLQFGWRMHECWPAREDGTCRCGCGRRLEGRRQAWASDECSMAAYRIYAVFAGHSGVIRDFVHARDKGVCASCGDLADSWEADHIVPVQRGGGGCGLDNFQTLCTAGCHGRKTAAHATERAVERRNDPTQLDLSYLPEVTG